MGRTFLAVLLAAVVLTGVAHASPCDPDDGGLRLPDGFCAKVFATNTGPVRNLVVADSGDVFAALRGRGRRQGGVLALRDTTGDGRVDERQRFGPRQRSWDRVLDGPPLLRRSRRGAALGLGARDSSYRRRRVRSWSTASPSSEATARRPSSLGADGALYVSVGAPSNACQKSARTPGSPGLDPCPQRDLQAGIWKYAADQPGQRHGPGRTLRARAAAYPRHGRATRRRITLGSGQRARSTRITLGFLLASQRSATGRGTRAPLRRRRFRMALLLLRRNQGSQGSGPRIRR